ncbi:stage II sporulation protein P [Caldicoprobacter guelmensis]|uniref:stage II sporulation protein P n=1 Tax=Caldicoprobacter guelmensis TaxID=1170224 RepID=UPI00195986F9|nr:stage II sporulation protein P [Caldicoprobacter guelmensis]MBM7581483.1 stage II sporulation protein P [Caldicoprobacter guelmensis]
MFRQISLLMMFVFFLLSIYPNSAHADDWYNETPDYFTVYLQDGTTLFKIGSRIYVDDEYISQNNKKYIITQVNISKKIAIAEFVEDIKLPDVSDLFSESFMPVLAQYGNKTIGIYCTHTDESYLPSDGAASIRANGGILDVARKLGEALKDRGIKAVVDTTPHDPHDAGAYRRSRQTAFRIIKEHRPLALFDVHRDAVPKEEYITRLNGQEITKVRIVVGKSNQNRQVNETFAYRIKAVADRRYPGLIKDIFIGKGSYNQELHPRSLLLEFGTYDHMKERALKSATLFAEVVDIALFGTTARYGERRWEQQRERLQEKQGAETQENPEAGRGLFILLLFVFIGGGIFFFLSQGKEEAFQKLINIKNLVLAIKENITNFLRK